MAELQPGESNGHREIRAKVRLDFKGVGKSGRFLFGGKAVEKVAEEAREHQVAMLRNVPIQGIQINDLDLSMDIYTIHDDIENHDVAFAPVIMDVSADTLEDLVRFIARDDFRKVEIISPAALNFYKTEMERLLFSVSREFKQMRENLERKYNR
ncbi:hypothetical protein [Desulfotomaculum copahuensis]|uniref:hypothetical protein n=1 Tax=Desulfotomaculum copahuensis TaxID=1838280 RepID=UPI000B14C0CD|nr:hypothetical protein [Desulfotomaculum copahuensis]